MTPELMPNPPEPQTPGDRPHKSGFIQGTLTTLAPGAGIIAGLSYGAPAIALIGTAAAIGIVGSAMAIKKKSNLIALGCLSAAITGLGIAMAGPGAALIAVTACGLGVSAAHKYTRENKDISLPKLLSGAFLGASLSILGAAACIGNVPADQKRGLETPVQKSALTPAFKTAQQIPTDFKAAVIPTFAAPSLKI